MKTLLFLGPTLRAAEAQARLPGVVVRPPAAAGDVLAAAGEGWDRIAVVDGYFERMAAIWHKELLWAMERGAAVYGAASMGAIRAAELAPHGMVGVGVICGWYRRGVVRDDAEVAVAHLPAERGYLPVTVALVNLRAALAVAVGRGVLGRAAAGLVLGSAGSVVYRERDWAASAAAARGAGVSAGAWRGFERFWQAEAPDRKAADARALLAVLAGPRPRRRARPAPVARTWAFARLRALYPDAHSTPPTSPTTKMPRRRSR